MRFFSISIWILTWDNVSAAFGSLYWCGFIMPIAIILLTKILPKVPRKPIVKNASFVDITEVNNDDLQIKSSSTNNESKKSQ